jgi:hypothetical protein
MRSSGSTIQQKRTGVKRKSGFLTELTEWGKSRARDFQQQKGTFHGLGI